MSFPHTKVNFTPNELNKNNTHEGSQVVEFYTSGAKFALGFWTATAASDTLADSPFLALIAWTPNGWEFIARLGVIWNDDLNMNMGSEEEDVHNYLWYIGQSFDEPLAAYLSENNMSDAPTTMWEKILAKLANVNIVDGHIKF